MSENLESTQVASIAHLSRRLEPVISSSSAPAATPMVIKLSSERCWLKSPAG